MSAQPEAVWRLQPMAPGHLDQVLLIEDSAYPVAWSRGVFEDCLRVGYSAWVAADTTGRVLGYALMTMAVGEAHLLNLCVAPARQRQGVASGLLDHLLRVARAGGVEQMFLEVRISNTAALALYRRYGFEAIGYRKGYYPQPDGSTEDAHVLALDLLLN